LKSQSENGGIRVGTFINFLWVTIGKKIFEQAGKELKPTGMVIR